MIGRVWLFFAGMMLLFSGCVSIGAPVIPMSRKTVIPEGVASSADDLADKLEAIKNTRMGFSSREIMHILNIKQKTPGVRDIVDVKEMRDIYYAGFEPRGTPDEAEIFRKNLAKVSIKEVVFKDVTEKVKLDSVISALVTQEGQDFKAHLIFLEDKLVEVRMPKNFMKKESDRNYITDGLRGIFSGGIGQGLKQIK